MPRPCILMVGAYPDAAMQAMAAEYDLLELWQPDGEARLAERAGEVRAIATRGDLGASADLMARLPALEIVACFGVGVDAIDLGYAASRGVAVTNTPDVLTEDVADLALALMLSVARGIPAGETHVRSGAWARGEPLPLGRRFAGSRVGILGMGRIGRAVARRAEAFGCEIRHHSRSPRPDLPYPREADPVALARWSEYLVLTLPGGAETEAAVGQDMLEALGSDGVLINLARGTVVDEPALIAALEGGLIRAAGLDVFLDEPEINRRWLALPNVVLQPHRGSATQETRAAMAALVAENLAAHFAGRPLVTPVPAPEQNKAS